MKSRVAASRAFKAVLFDADASVKELRIVNNSLNAGRGFADAEGLIYIYENSCIVLTHV